MTFSVLGKFTTPYQLSNRCNTITCSEWLIIKLFSVTLIVLKGWMQLKGWVE